MHLLHYHCATPTENSNFYIRIDNLQNLAQQIGKLNVHSAPDMVSVRLQLLDGGQTENFVFSDSNQFR